MKGFLKQFVLNLLFWVVPLMATTAPALSNFLDCPTAGAGNTCNVYNSFYVPSRTGICVDSSYCKPTNRTDCKGICLDGASYAATDTPDGGACTTSGGVSGNCNCGLGGSITGFSSASCLTGPATPTPPPGVVSMYPSSIDFGVLAVGSSSATQTVTVNNRTTSSFMGCSNTYDTTNFTITNNLACFGLSAGASCSFQVKANPTVSGALTTTMNFNCGPTSATLTASACKNTDVCTNGTLSGYFNGTSCITGRGRGVSTLAPPYTCSASPTCTSGASCFPVGADYGGTWNASTNTCDYGNGTSTSSPVVCQVPAVSAPTASPTAAPTSSGSCNYSLNGPGRACTTNTDCCSGVCAVAGAQPMRQSPDCVAGDSTCVNGVKFWTNFDPTRRGPCVGRIGSCLNSYDWFNSSPATQAADAPISSANHYLGPSKICIGTSNAPPANVPNNLQVSGTGHDAAALAYDASNGFTCMLDKNDKHRVKDAYGKNTICACEITSDGTIYEPVVIPTTSFSSIVSNQKIENRKLENLWALLVEALESYRPSVKEVKKVYEKWVPESKAVTSALSFTFTPNTFDFGSVNVGTSSTAQTVSIKNTSSSAANGCVVSVSDATNFALTSNCSYIPAGGTCAVTLAANPTVASTQTASLSIFCDGGLAAVQKFDENAFFANLYKDAKRKALRSFYGAYHAMIPEAGACSAPMAGGGCQANLNCPADHSTTAAVTVCCCSITWVDCGFVSRDACICSQYPYSSSCVGGGGGGSVGAPGPSGSGTSGLYSVTGTAVPVPSCNTGDTCSNSTLSGTWNGSCCIGGAVGAQTCLAPTITCTPATPSCNVGDSCSNASATGTWDGTCCIGGMPGLQMCLVPPIMCTSATPTPAPISTTSVSDLYAGSTTVALATAQHYGTNNNGTAVASAANLSGSSPTMKVACVKQCPLNSIRSLTNPLTCDCSANASAPNYNPVSNQCETCPVLGQQIDSTGKCQCPPGYESRGGSCRPKLPSKEFVANDNTDNYPTCSDPTVVTGAIDQRIPVKYDMSVQSISGTQTPLTTMSSIWNGISAYPYPYASSSGVSGKENPVYLYRDQPHCACVGSSIKAPPYIPLTTAGAPLSTKLSADTFDAISSFDVNGKPNKTYGMVAIDEDSTRDGRLGLNFGNTSECSCPNVNELPMAVSADARAGVSCVSPLKNDPQAIFAQFDPVKDKDMILNGTRELLDSSGKVVSAISLPASATSPQSLVQYKRHIWKCQIGYKLNITTAKCEWDATAHECDSTSPLPSKLSDGGKNFPAWDSIINKRLSCCVNDMNANTLSSSVKFDCVDNSSFAAKSNFNDLWAQDPSQLAGQLNALVLASGNYQPLTGWYTTEGKRCSEFSEFSLNPIIPGTVNPVTTTIQQDKLAGDWLATGTPIPMPVGDAYFDITSKLGARARAPNPSAMTLEELNNARRCPILIRAALVTQCPHPTTTANAPQYTVTDQPTGITRCPSASGIQVHVRVEQVFKITGQDTLRTMDTIMDQKSANHLNVGELLKKKDQNSCLPGMKMVGSTCSY